MYYPCLKNGIPQNKILISGNCPDVKKAIIKEQLRRARNQNFSVILLDYARTGDFSPFLSQNGYPVCHRFVAENNTYIPLERSLREDALSLRNSAKKNNYSHKEHASMLALIDFLDNLEKKCGSVSNSVEEMLKKFKNQQKFENFLKEQVINKKIKREETDDYIQTYLEYMPSGIIADVLIAEQKFIFNKGENEFSLSYLKQGEVAVLHASIDNSQDINDFLTEAWTRDILKIYQNMPLVLIINGGVHTQIKRLYELISTLSATETGIVYCCFDIFSGYKAEDSESFTHFFEYVLYGQHTGQSAQNISNLFGEKWVYKYSYTSGTSNSITEEWLPIVFPYEKSLTTSTSIHRTQVREPEIPQNKIISMTKKEYIILSKNENRYLKASVP